MLFERHAGFLGEDTGGQLLGRHFEREEADDRAVLGDGLAGRIAAGAIGLGGVEADIGRERGLAHRRAAGEDHQVGRVQAAQQLVEIEEAGGDTGGLAAALDSRLGGHDRVGQRAAEGAEAALGLTDLGEIEKLSSRPARSVSPPAVEIVLIGLVDHILADGDELAAQKRSWMVRP